MRSPFMQSLQSRLADPSFQRGITDAGLSILANSGPSTQRRSTGQILAGGAMQGMASYDRESERQKKLAQEQRLAEATKEAAAGIENPAMQRLAMADPEFAKAILAKQMERETTDYQKAQLGQGDRRIGLQEDQNAVQNELAQQRIGLQEQGLGLQRDNADRRFGLQEQGLDLQRENAAATQAHREAQIAAQAQNQPLVEVVGEDGQVRYVPRNQAAGQVAPKKSPMVQVNTGEQNAFAKEKGKIAAKRFGGIIESGANARRNSAKIDSLLQLNDNALSGFGADVRLEAARAGNFVGIGDGETVAATEAMNAGLSDIVLQKQIEQKGPQTESDAKRLEKTVGNLTTSKEAREALLTAAKADADYQSAYGDRVEELVDEDMPLKDATRTAREELGDAPNLLKVFEDLAGGDEPEEQETPEFDASKIPDLESRGEALEQQFISQGMTQEDAEQAAMAQLKQEFGL